MAGIFIYSDRPDIVAELVGFAKGTGELSTIIACRDEQMAACKNLGADRILLLEGKQAIDENYGKVIADLFREQAADLLVVGSTPRGRDIAARVAGYLDCGMSSDVLSLSYRDGKVVTKRLLYGGSVIRRECWQVPAVVTVAAGKFEAAPGGESPVIRIAVTPDTRMNVTGKAPIMKEGVDLRMAGKIVCVGMGLEKEQDLQMVRDLADALGAEIGCSRGVAEDRHWLPTNNYIGISGVTVKPQLYLSLGVSGQVQHVVGIRDSKLIVAIDLNAKAPIFKACDYGIVGDLYEIAPLLTEILKRGGDNGQGR